MIPHEYTHGQSIQMYNHMSLVESLEESYSLAFDTHSLACLKMIFDLGINYWSYSDFS